MTDVDAMDGVEDVIIEMVVFVVMDLLVFVHPRRLNYTSILVVLFCVVNILRQYKIKFKSILYLNVTQSLLKL